MDTRGMFPVILFGLVMVMPSLNAEDSIFADLTVDEMENVVSYLNTQNDIALVSGKDITLNTSWIYAIETLTPVKEDALFYLDNDIRKPPKTAKVTIFRGDLRPPGIQEYAVSPIPISTQYPTEHKLLRYNNTKSPIPFYARSPNNHLDGRLFLVLLKNEMKKVDDVLYAITGLHYVDCIEEEGCLTWIFGGPADSGGRNRSIIIGITRDFEGFLTHPIGLECLMLMPGVDESKWQISWVSFRGMSFSSFDNMKTYYSTAPSPVADRNQPINDETLPSSGHFRGTPRPQENRRGPRSHYPDGPRYAINNNHIEWLGWQFDFGMPTTQGPRLHDIRFLGERIAYEVSLQETAVFYSGASALFSHSMYYDSYYNMGTTFSMMAPGIDCPQHAYFGSTVHFFRNKVVTFKNAYCIFELDKGMPLRRHMGTDYDGGYYYLYGMPDNVLVFRTALSVDNYDYIYDFVFHQGGQIEVRVATSGAIIASYYQDSTQDKYGFRVSDDTTQGVLHSHMYHFKVDLDILGPRNRFCTRQITTHKAEDPLDSSKMLVKKFMKESVKSTEREAAYKYNFDTPTVLVMYNEEMPNKFGNKRGYRILNKGMSTLLDSTDLPGGKARSWGEYQVAITKRKESEARSSTPYTYMDQNDPVVNFEDFIDDNEYIIDEDLVAWVTMGVHHIPIAEDIPIVQTAGNQVAFYLIPFNYFDEDPTLASRDHIRIEPGKDGSFVYYLSGVPPDGLCNMEGITCKGIVKGKKDEPKASMAPVITPERIIIILVVIWINILCI